MQIKKVVTDSFFKKEYYQINDDILEKGFAIKKGYYHILESFDKAFLKADKEVKPNFTVKAEYRAFPSYEKMISMIDDQANNIIETLKLNQIKCENNEIIKAMLLFEYLIKNASYDMTTQEFLKYVATQYQAEEDEKVEKIDELKYRYNQLWNIQQSRGLNEEEKNEVHTIFNELANTAKQNDDILIKTENSVIATAMFDTLIYKKGVCSNFSYTYEYILNKLNIKSFIIEVQNDKTGIGHVFNVLEKRTGEKKAYYAVDITHALNYKKFGTNIMLEQFGLDKEALGKSYYNMVAVWERVNPINKLEEEIYFVNTDELKREKIKELLSSKKDLIKQKNITKTFIKVKLTKDENER